MTAANVEEAPFNMAMLFYFGLNELLTKKSQSIIAGDIETSFQCCEEIFTKISFKLDRDEYKNMEKKLAALRLRITLIKMNDISGISQDLILKQMREIDRLIMKHLHRYKMIFPNIDTKHGIDKITTRYNL